MNRLQQVIVYNKTLVALVLILALVLTTVTPSLKFFKGEVSNNSDSSVNSEEQSITIQYFFNQEHTTVSVKPLFEHPLNEEDTVTTSIFDSSNETPLSTNEAGSTIAIYTANAGQELPTHLSFKVQVTNDGTATHTEYLSVEKQYNGYVPYDPQDKFELAYSQNIYIMLRVTAYNPATGCLTFNDESDFCHHSLEVERPSNAVYSVEGEDVRSNVNPRDRILIAMDAVRMSIPDRLLLYKKENNDIPSSSTFSTISMTKEDGSGNFTTLIITDNNNNPVSAQDIRDESVEIANLNVKKFISPIGGDLSSFSKNHTASLITPHSLFYDHVQYAHSISEENSNETNAWLTTPFDTGDATRMNTGKIFETEDETVLNSYLDNSKNLQARVTLKTGQILETNKYTFEQNDHTMSLVSPIEAKLRYTYFPYTNNNAPSGVRVTRDILSHLNVPIKAFHLEESFNDEEFYVENTSLTNTLEGVGYIKPMSLYYSLFASGTPSLFLESTSLEPNTYFTSFNPESKIHPAYSEFKTNVLDIPNFKAQLEGLIIAAPILQGTIVDLVNGHTLYSVATLTMANLIDFFIHLLLGENLALAGLEDIFTDLIDDPSDNGIATILDSFDRLNFLDSTEEEAKYFLLPIKGWYTKSFINNNSLESFGSSLDFGSPLNIKLESFNEDILPQYSITYTPTSDIHIVYSVFNQPYGFLPSHYTSDNTLQITNIGYTFPDEQYFFPIYSGYSDENDEQVEHPYLLYKYSSKTNSHPDQYKGIKYATFANGLYKDPIETPLTDPLLKLHHLYSLEDQTETEYPQNLHLTALNNTWFAEDIDLVNLYCTSTDIDTVEDFESTTNKKLFHIISSANNFSNSIPFTTLQEECASLDEDTVNIFMEVEYDHGYVYKGLSLEDIFIKKTDLIEEEIIEEEIIEEEIEEEEIEEEEIEEAPEKTTTLFSLDFPYFAALGDTVPLKINVNKYNIPLMTIVLTEGPNNFNSKIIGVICDQKTKNTEIKEICIKNNTDVKAVQGAKSITAPWKTAEDYLPGTYKIQVNAMAVDGTKQSVTKTITLIARPSAKKAECYNYFVDMQANSPLCSETTYLYEQGIFLGQDTPYGKTAALNQPLLRSEYFAIAARLRSSALGMINSSFLLSFRDLNSQMIYNSQNHWWLEAVSTLQGIVRGYGDNTLRPTAPLAQAELGKVAAEAVVPLFKNDDSKNPWYTDTVQFYQSRGLMLNPNTVAYRADAVRILYSLLYSTISNSDSINRGYDYSSSPNYNYVSPYSSTPGYSAPF